MQNVTNKINLFKVVVFFTALLPFVWLVFSAINNLLGTNPVETLTHETGLWAFRFLLIGLVITPLRFYLKMHRLVKLRRMIGLFSFFYACLHFVIYIWFDQNFDWQDILIDIPKRPFITIGFIAFILLLPLVITSTKAMQKRLKKRWRQLHQLVYFIPVLVVIHFIWSLKADYRQPLIYLFIFVCLMLLRLFKNKKSPTV